MTNQRGPTHPSLDVAVVGSGVVGTATGLGLAVKGHRVVFCDVDPVRVRLLRDKGFDAMRCTELPIDRPDADLYLISVPTPTVLGRTDISHLRDAAGAVGMALASHSGWPTVVVRSTVPPGTTDEVVIPVLEETSGRRAGTDFGVAMNPEFLRAATAEEDFLHPRVIVIGSLDERSEDAVRRLYAAWVDVPIVAADLRTAEATKYLANLFNATKISFFNEMHRVLLTVGVDPTVASGAATLGAEGLWNPGYGTRGGAPYGGACLPKDAAGFLGYLEDRGLASLAPILQAAIRINDEMGAWADPAPGARTDGPSRRRPAAPAEAAGELARFVAGAGPSGNGNGSRAGNGYPAGNGNGSGAGNGGVREAADREDQPVT